MSGKTISTGTMGLRFMQNAQRAKHLKEVEAEKAHVQDEAEWEVDQKVRDAWGISSSSYSSQTVTHEASYLPFLFPSLEQSSDSLSDRPKGRRAFNKRGEEIKEKETDPITAQTEDQKVSQPPTKKQRVHPHPVSISKSSGTLSGFPEKTTKSTKTAKETIFDNAGVGADLHSKPTPGTPVFLKPAGVDGPSTNGSNTTKARAKSRRSTGSPQTRNNDPPPPELDADIIPSTRNKKTKRDRSTTDQIEGDSTKRKKKKSAS